MGQDASKNTFLDTINYTMNKQPLYVQFGAGNEAVSGWLSFDSSPTLKIQKLPLIGSLLRSRLNCVFDEDIQVGDIVRGLPLEDNSVDGLFCSHVLEHLTFSDFSIALTNCFRYLKRGGIFRIIVPDLNWYILEYLSLKQSGDNLLSANAAVMFMKGTCLGRLESRRSIRRRLYEAFSNSSHRWMWDFDSLSLALHDHGFVGIKRFVKGECEDEMFLRPERLHQFGDKEKSVGLAIECSKPF